MVRRAVQGAGGIVLRRTAPPLIAVVRLRKHNEWVLPKGKIDDGETPRTAAEREVNEETGHAVIVHEFLGTLVYVSGSRSKVVHYWRMEADGEQACELTSEVREVDWLPLDAALARLSRSYERAFLENVGPLAVDAAGAGPRDDEEDHRQEDEMRPRIVEATPATPIADAAPLSQTDPCAPMPESPSDPSQPQPAVALSYGRRWLRSLRSRTGV